MDSTNQHDSKAFESNKIDFHENFTDVQSIETCRKVLFSTKMHKIPRIDTMAKMMTGCNGASTNGNMALYGLRQLGLSLDGYLTCTNRLEHKDSFASQPTFFLVCKFRESFSASRLTPLNGDGHGFNSRNALSWTFKNGKQYACSHGQGLRALCTRLIIVDNIKDGRHLCSASE